MKNNFYLMKDFKAYYPVKARKKPLIGMHYSIKFVCTHCRKSLLIEGRRTDVYFRICPDCEDNVHVQPSSGFTSALTIEEIHKLFYVLDTHPKLKCIVDDYGKEYSFETFRGIINKCHVCKIDNSIGWN